VHPRVHSHMCVCVCACGCPNLTDTHAHTRTHSVSQLLQKPDGLYRRLVNRQMQGHDLASAFNDLARDEGAGARTTTAAPPVPAAYAAPSDAPKEA
jgi:hypothetical protein